MAKLPTLLAKLENEPIVKRLFSLAGVQALILFAFSQGWITPDQLATIMAAFTALGVPMSLSARAQVYGPVTFQRATNPDTHPEIPAEYHGQG